MKRVSAETAEEHLQAAAHHIGVLEEASDNSWASRRELAHLHIQMALAQATLRAAKAKR
jgi:hypothetical protein